MKKWAALPIALVCACVGTEVTVVRGPDGEKALLIEASSQLEALQKAREECPDGYNILNSTTSVRMAPQLMRHSTLELLISCKRESRGQSESSAAPATAAAPDPDPCRSVSGEVDDFVEFWAGLSKAEPVDKNPRGSAFVDLCYAMPAPVQPCFQKSYRKVHEKLCVGYFGRLDEPRRTRLNAALVR